jgi:hypothetical protein
MARFEIGAEPVIRAHCDFSRKHMNLDIFTLGVFDADRWSMPDAGSQYCGLDSRHGVRSSKAFPVLKSTGTDK